MEKELGFEQLIKCIPRDDDRQSQHHDRCGQYATHDHECADDLF
jgi:hypothetical protein